LVLAGSTLLLNSGDKAPISYEIQLPSEQMTLPRDGVMTSISDGLSSKQKLNFVVLIGETGIGKTTLARRYIKNNDFAVKGEIDAETENKIVQSIENMLFVVQKRK
jgi:ABC-type nitrate/sulfonate/bicarbonate transport system ATPase subunit